MIDINKVTLLITLFGSITYDIVSGTAFNLTICENGKTCISHLQCKDVNTSIENKVYIEYIKTRHCGFYKDIPQICCEKTNVMDNDSNKIANESIPMVMDTSWPTVQVPEVDSISEEKLVAMTTITSFKRFPEPKMSSVDPIGGTNSRFQVEKLRLLPNRLVCGKHEINSKVIGGDLTDIAEFPWTALLIYDEDKSKNDYDCGGTLISNLYVVTAAHCLNVPSGKSIKRVRLGEWNYNTEIDCYGKDVCNGPIVEIAVLETYVHPNSSKNSLFRDDIALLRLAEPVNFTAYIRPICLPTTYAVSQIDTQINISYWVAGWGKTEYGNKAPVKHKVSLDSLPLNECRRAYSYLSDLIFESVICVGGERGKDSCNGDSGGPLMRETKEKGNLNWYLYGVISFGDKNCGTEGHPGVYVRITSHMDWILATIKP